MKILIAPDKFKGTLRAEEVCHLIAEVFKEERPFFDVMILPLADGGDGTSGILTSFSKGFGTTAEVHDPLGRLIKTSYGISSDGATAFIEMASASGLGLLSGSERDPAYTTTVGTGELILDAISKGVKKVILGIGGSATHDGGMGLASAFGIKFLNYQGETLKPIGKNLIAVKSIDLTDFNQQMKHVEFIILNDVTNPLTGPSGAAFTYAPQKGADKETVQILELGLQNFARVIRTSMGKDIEFPGAGAGGGICGGIHAFLKSTIVSGTTFVNEFVGLEKQVSEADLIISGEGKIDVQTLSGKVVAGILELCSRYSKPLYLFAGSSELLPTDFPGNTVQKIITLVDEDTSREKAMKESGSVLKSKVRQWIKTLGLTK